MAPVRTCLGCRARVEKVDLIRIVARDNGIVADPGQRLPGRGCYLHPRAECLQQATKRRAFGRALRRPGLDPSLGLADLRSEAGRLGESAGSR